MSVALDPLGALRQAPNPIAFEKKIHAPPNQNSWIRPWNFLFR